MPCAGVRQDDFWRLEKGQYDKEYGGVRESETALQRLPQPPQFCKRAGDHCPTPVCSLIVSGGKPVR